MHAIMSNFFASTSNVPFLQLVCLKSIVLIEEIPLQFLDEEALFCMKVGACSPVGTYQIVLIGDIHGRKPGE
jgi:hypothetical protein